MLDCSGVATHYAVGMVAGVNALPEMLRPPLPAKRSSQPIAGDTQIAATGAQRHRYTAAGPPAKYTDYSRSYLARY